MGRTDTEEVDGTFYLKPSLPETSFLAPNVSGNVLTTGLRPDPLGELKLLTRHPSHSGCGRFAARWGHFAAKIDCFPNWFEPEIATA